jgi:hypothetical protein
MPHIPADCSLLFAGAYRLEEPTGLRDTGFIVQCVCRFHLIPSLARRTCPSILKGHRSIPLASVMRHFILISQCILLTSNVSGSPLRR